MGYAAKVQPEWAIISGAEGRWSVPSPITPPLRVSGGPSWLSSHSTIPSEHADLARIRSIKPGFFRNEDLAAFPFQHRLLFAGLWLLADREGRLEDRPKRIHADLFPYDPALDVEQ